MTNQLANETSPYLLQHANNPVDWRPWGPEALELAKQQQKPIFLSIGYSACHWCHVMEHESFENEEIAAFLNQHFISIKVDREERPDLDQIYMTAVQLLTGRGGWPMSVFLTPDLKPFYGGTYWPPVPSRGMPGFLQVLQAVEEAWRVRREAALGQAEQLTNHIASMGVGESDVPATPELLRSAAERLNREFDPEFGGFGRSPKFPHATDLHLLLRLWTREPHPQLLKIVETTLDKMARGGIYDHLGGGFARYSVDERWLVPHFEKMLYDNALLMGVYLDAYLATQKPQYARIAQECGDYLLTYMTDPAGGIHSTEDADSEGEEGKFYVWSKQEIVDLLGQEEAEPFCAIYGVTEGGNFEGHNILHLAVEPRDYAEQHGIALEELEKRLAAARVKLLEVRNRRIRPGKDDKVLTSWNALAISSLARAGAILGAPRFLDAARRAADFLLSTMREEEGGLLHTYRAGVARQKGFLEDYAYLTNALIDLFEAEGDASRLQQAVELADQMLARFEDPQSGGFYFTPSDGEVLIARQKDPQDQSTPSGNGMAATALLRLAAFTGSGTYLRSAERAIEHFAGVMQKHSLATGQLLVALDWLLGPRSEWVLTLGSNEAENWTALERFAKAFAPRTVRWVRRSREEPPAVLAKLAAGKSPQEAPVLYQCEGFSCRAPAVGMAAIEERLRAGSA